MPTEAARRDLEEVNGRKIPPNQDAVVRVARGNERSAGRGTRTKRSGATCARVIEAIFLGKRKGNEQTANLARPWFVGGMPESKKTPPGGKKKRFGGGKRGGEPDHKRGREGQLRWTTWVKPVA